MGSEVENKMKSEVQKNDYKPLKMEVFDRLKNGDVYIMKAHQ